MFISKERVLRETEKIKLHEKEKMNMEKARRDLEKQYARKKYSKEDVYTAYFIWASVILGWAFVFMRSEHLKILGTILTVVAIAGVIKGFIEMFKGKHSKQLITTVDTGIKSIDELSVSVKIPYDKTLEMLVAMIADGVFDDIYIDTLKREIVKKPPNNQAVNTTAHYVPKNCPSCGAPNSAEAVQNGKCEYCGAQL